jgi:AcrR family transcriptional regulator
MARKARDEARRAREDVYRQHIFEAAEKVFAERGFEAAKVQEIARAAELSMGTIYAIFPGKTELYRGLLEERGRELLGLVRGVVSRGSGPREALDALIELYVGYFVEHPDFLRMHLRAGTSWGLAPGALDADSRVAHWEEIQSLQSDVFRRGIAEGVFVEEDPAYLARMFSVMDQVVLADWVVGGMRAGREELVRRLRGWVERGFCRPPGHAAL